MNKPKSVKIETPIGSIESDSGNHLVDVGTVVLLTFVLYLVIRFMLNASQINLKVCGITSSKSIKIAAGKNIRTLGFASSNLHGPNTCNDKKLKDLIEECNEYKIEAVLLSKYQSTYELIKQIDYTKPKTIACSYFYDKSELKKLKKIFKRLRIGISINPERFDFK